MIFGARSTRVLARISTGALALATVMMVGVPAANAGKPTNGGGGGTGVVTASSYSGRAYVASATVTLLGAPVTVGPISDTGALPSTGGMLDSSLLTVGPLSAAPITLAAEVASSTTVGSGDQSDSQASVASLGLGVSVPPLLSLGIGADVVASQAQAKCTSTGPVTSGASQIAALTINGQSITITGAPNQTINVLGLITVTINEQITAPGSITVNALHVAVLQNTVLSGILSGDIVVSSSHADVICPGGGNPPPPPPPCQVKDFVTGGGYINAPGKVNFGLVGGQKSQGLSGHLNVVDHNAGGPHISAGTVVSYSDPNPPSTTRKIVYSGTVNGVAATITVVVTDNGEPGTADRFSVTTSTGYSASGVLAGGNIQLHQPGGCTTSSPSSSGGGKKGH